MAKLSFLHFHPERIAWIGAIVLGTALLFALPCFVVLSVSQPISLGVRGKKESAEAFQPFTFSMGLSEKSPILPIPDLQGEMSFSFDPPRPDGVVDGKRLLVRMKKSGESKRVVMPCRIDLEFHGDKLRFAKGDSSFWLELTDAKGGQIEGRGFITSLEGCRIDAGKFIVAGQDCPIQGAQEFPEGSPFRLLGEARWWGRDLFLNSTDAGERLEIGSADLLELRGGDWLVWKDQKWQKCEAPEKDLPVAHIQTCAPRALVLEGWDSVGHIRVSLNPAAGPPFKMRGEELFTSIRMRSEKQISCMLEKQCMVLRTGDWVLKTGGRWKVLRKKDERDAFMNGKLFGELFVFDQISQKQGQKMIVGKLFNPGRTQVIAIEMSAHSARKTGGKDPLKARSR